MNIKSIRLRNFRGFRNAPIVLKPLTVLLGPNSAGKSSFGQALAAMAHVHKYYASTPQASLTPPPNDDVDTWPVDLGTTDDLRTKGATGPVTVELVTRGGVVKIGFGNLSHTSALLVSHISLPTGDQSGAERPAPMAVKDVLPGQTSGVIPIEGSIHDGSARSDLKHSVEITKINERQWQEGSDEVSVIMDGLVVKAIQHTTGTSRPLSNVSQEDVRSFLESLTYLRANRKRPSRGYKDGEGKLQSIGYSGEWAPSIRLRRGPDQVLHLEPPSIPNSLEEARRADYTWKEKRESLSSALDSWLARIGLASQLESSTSTSDRRVFVNVRVAPKDQSPHDITEVGFGVSQVMPVLIAGLLQPKESLFIVDLPEAHLHPRPQSEIADFFCSLALSDRYSLVETHSEMFFHRLRLRAAMEPRLLDRIAVYFIDAPKNGICNDPRPVGLGFEEELQWPAGFLQEAWETETQINAVREARRQSRE